MCKSFSIVLVSSCSKTNEMFIYSIAEMSRNLSNQTHQNWSLENFIPSCVEFHFEYYYYFYYISPELIRF